MTEDLHVPDLFPRDCKAFGSFWPRLEWHQQYVLMYLEYERTAGVVYTHELNTKLCSCLFAKIRLSGTHCGQFASLAELVLIISLESVQVSAHVYSVAATLL